MNSSRTLSLLAFVAIALIGVSASAEPVVIKLATVAPKDSPWMKAYTAMDAEVQKATEGRVSFKFFPGMVSGDDKDMVRKMRAGQLQAAGLTGVGMQMIEPNTLVLQLPLLFNDYEEMDKVRTRMEGRMQGLMQKKGFVILGWSDIGYTYVFTKTPVDSLASFKDVKMWGWEDEPISKAFFETAGIAQVPLSLSDVLPSLQRGMITGVYNSPLGAVSLQWDKYTSYVTKMWITIGIGATVVKKDVWDKISTDDQKKILEIGNKYHRQLCADIRQKNKAASATLKKNGIKFVDVPQAEVQRFREIAAKVRAKLAGSMLDAGLVKEVESMIAKVRAGQ